MKHIPIELLFASFVLVATALAALAASRLKLPAAIVWLSAGLVLAFAPGMPRFPNEPSFVLVGLLPLVLYSSGVGMSWRGFRANLRPILMLAIGCVLFTASAVATLVHFAFGLPWAVGFILGSIVSPPDSIAPMAIARRLGVPSRVLVVLEGESLCNDATALILFGLALSAVSSGDWSAGRAVAAFLVIAVTEPAWGIAVAWAALQLRKRLGDPQVEIAIALLTPFAAFWPPYLTGGSGVLATVAAGLFVSRNGAGFISAATRLQGFFIWEFIDFIVAGALFLLTGIQARDLVGKAGGAGWLHLLFASALVTLTVLIVRFLWVFPVEHLSNLLSSRFRSRDPAPPRGYRFVVGFTGIRGGESLAAALFVPTMVGAEPFPARDLILLATCCVIVVTLLGQGLALPWVIRRTGLAALGRAEARHDERDEIRARVSCAEAALRHLRDIGRTGTHAALVRALTRRQLDRRAHLTTTVQTCFRENPLADEALLQLGLVEAQRRSNAASFAHGLITDDARRRIERGLDLEEACARHAASVGLRARPPE